MKKPLLLFAWIVSIQHTFSQAPGIEWQQSLGGNGYDQATSIQQTTDGGYIVAGISNSINGDVTGHHGDFFSFDCWVAKLSAAGAIQWQRSLGGSKNEGDILGSTVYSVRQVADGGYIVAGSSKSDDGDITGHHPGGGEEDNHDYWLVKLSTAGDIQWQKSLGGSLNDHAFSVEPTNDGGYIVAGYSFSNDGDVAGHHGDEEDPLEDCWVVKLDGTGTLQWQQSLGGTFHDQAFSIKQTADNGYIVAGYTVSNDGDVSGNSGDSYWIVKLGTSGNLEWQKALGGTGVDKAHAIQQTTDGGYIIAGASSSDNGDVSGNHGGYDYWVVKTDATGNIEWQKALGGTEDDIAYDVQQTADGGYIVAGYTQSGNGDVNNSHGASDYWIVKLGSSGNLEWQKALGGTGNEVAYAIRQTTGGGFVIAGWASSTDGDVTLNKGGIYDYWIVKLSAIALPVHLLSFEGRLQNGVAQLSWSTAAEENFMQFELEKSVNGNAFTRIGVVPAQGNNSRYTRQAPQAELQAYYRLKMVDKDGSSRYSKVIRLQQQVNDPALAAYPNPAGNIMYVKTTRGGEAIIYNAAGVAVKKITLHAGTNSFDIAALSSGAYYIVCDNQHLSFIKQ